MQTFGSDRVREGDGEQLILSSRLSKGWTPRTPKSLTHSEFPGTAVLWEEQFFEVVDIEHLPAGGVRYILEPWRDEHAMRTTDRYDAESEAARIEAHRAEVMRETKRKSTTLFGVFTGHLPGAVQEHLGRELGTSPVKLTMLSAIALFIISGPIVFYCFALLVGGRPLPIPYWLFALLSWWTAASLFRFNFAFASSRPLGSLEGYIGYGIFYALAPKSPDRISPFASERGSSTKAVRFDFAPPDVALQDALIMREPLVTLLPPAEQLQISLRTGYDYTRKSLSTAIYIIVIAGIGVVSSWISLRSGRGFSAFTSLIVAGWLVVEQIMRIASFRKGPAGSVLAFFVRPLTRKLL
ncbi:MAG: hypothetical protein QOI24_2222 [Acidobacteriota bacterium]|jgi:hypothetical protein|nr:hypothetical protein [Acidobacteriota bacterium]